jgi:SulP family sulfate permease
MINTGSKINNRLIKLKIQKPKNLKNDILSGFTVALALVPEAIAFAFVAHIDPIIGLYAAFMVGLITAIFGGRPGMISGATGAVAVIFAPLVITQTKIGGMEAGLGYLFAAVALMGVIQIIFGLLKLGKFIRLVPHSVMLGFVNGLAIVIFKSQFEMFKTGHGDHSQWIGGSALYVMLTLIAITMLISHFLPKLTKAIPATLVAIITVTFVSFGLDKLGFELLTVLDFVKGIDPSRTTLAASLPTFSIPSVPFNFHTLQIILPFSLLAAAVGLIESLMTLSLVDELTNTRGKGNKESIGQGLANLINGFFGGMGGCAMIGQSMINIRAGGRGRTSGITAALTLLIFILWGSVLIEMIPLAALVGVMFMVVIATFEWSSIRLFGKIPNSDFIIIILVSVVTVVSDLAIAVIIGIIASAIVFAWNQGKKISTKTRIDEHGTKIYEIHGALFFGSATNFKELFNFQDKEEHIVIDFADARVYDHSGVEAINNITERYATSGSKLHLFNLSSECRDLVNKAENITEITIIEGLDWHLADNKLG